MKNQKGFLRTILLIIIALALIKLVWDFDIFEWIDNKPQLKEIWDAIVGVFKKLWSFIKNLFSSAF